MSSTSLNVESLLDVVESQLCVHGDRALFVYAMDENEPPFSLFVSGDFENPLFDCVNKQESCEYGFGLEVLRQSLSKRDGKAIIYCSSDRHVIKGFKLGFKAEGRFVLTLDSRELIIPTVVR